jgi:hypothetical protein
MLKALSISRRESWGRRFNGTAKPEDADARSKWDFMR